jgi:hypothetical protein
MLRISEAFWDLRHDDGTMTEARRDCMWLWLMAEMFLNGRVGWTYQMRGI